METKQVINRSINVAVSILLGAGILYWMYRGFDFDTMMSSFTHETNWWWMSFSLIFGVLAQVFRALRWKQSLEPLGEKPRLMDCVHAVFLSYASSLVIPRIGEVLRCGVLKRYDGTSFSKAVGTVVVERIIDTLLLGVLTLVVLLSQLPVFITFFENTGTNFTGFLSSFTTAGYIVTAICGIATVIFIWLLAKKLKFHAKIKDKVQGIKDGMMSLRGVKNKGLLAFYSVGIWASYFLHYAITFKCFGFTEDLGFAAAMVSFVIGSISVIVPTPNGAGPWHFAVKTILVLYGIGEADAALFVFTVHTVQTALIPVLGLYSVIALAFRKSLPAAKE